MTVEWVSLVEVRRGVCDNGNGGDAKAIGVGLCNPSQSVHKMTLLYDRMWLNYRYRRKINTKWC